MSVIKNDDNIKSPKPRKKNIYELPAVVRKDKDEISFEKSLVLALIFHPLVIIILLLSSFILKLLGIDFSLFKKPDLKPKDIEFVLVEKEAPPIDKNTKNRSDKNSQAGGKHDPKRKVSLPQQEAPKSPAVKPKPAAPQKKQTPKSQPKQEVKQQPKQQPKPQQVQKPVVKSEPVVQNPAPAPKPQAPKPTVSSSVPKPTVNPASNFNIPIPKSAIPQIAQPTTAPVTAAPKVGGNASGSAGGSAAPSFSPTMSNSGSGASAGGGGRFSNSSGSGRANLGNPGPGNPNGAPGIDAIKEPDFGPYMKELQRRIKMNWDPPKGNESKRVVLLFSIARDGRLLNVKVHRSSGLQAADNAAIEAVKLTAPFRPLPPEFKGQSVDIQFTFDYNVFGISY